MSRFAPLWIFHAAVPVNSCVLSTYVNFVSWSLGLLYAKCKWGGTNVRAEVKAELSYHSGFWISCSNKLLLLLKKYSFRQFSFGTLAPSKSTAEILGKYPCNLKCKEEKEICSCHMARHISMTIPKDLEIFVSIIQPGSAQKISFHPFYHFLLDRQKVPSSSELGSCVIPTAALRGEGRRKRWGKEEDVQIWII